MSIWANEFAFRMCCHWCRHWDHSSMSFGPSMTACGYEVENQVLEVNKLWRVWMMVRGWCVDSCVWSLWAVEYPQHQSICIGVSAVPYTVIHPMVSIRLWAVPYLTCIQFPLWYGMIPSTACIWLYGSIEKKFNWNLATNECDVYTSDSQSPCMLWTEVIAVSVQQCGESKKWRGESQEGINNIVKRDSRWAYKVIIWETRHQGQTK